MRSVPLKAIIVSRNFNPGHYSHLVANYKLLSDNHINTFMYHHTSFNKMSVIENERVFNNIFELKALGKIDLAIFWFPSLKNIIDIILLRLFYRTHIIYIFHEPLESVNSYLAAGFGFLRTFRILLVGSVSYFFVLMSDKIVLPSKKAFETFESKYLHTNKDYELIPLLFDDEAAHINTGNQRPFISYIGTIAEDHAFDEYVKFVVHAIINNCFPKYKFLVATKSTVPLAQRNALLPHIESGAVVLEEGRPMSNEKINYYYNNSIVVWNAYRRSMQSGVLPKAYMFGTPLLVSSCNSSEYFDNRKHGVSVSEKYDVEELKKAVVDIVTHFEKYSKCCRDKFLSTFFYKANEHKFIKFTLDGTDWGK